MERKNDMTRNRLLRNIARCKKCNTVIESVTTHDFNYCKCKSIFVDGGQDYVKRGGTDLDLIEEMSVYIKISDQLDMKFQAGQLWIDDVGRVVLLYEILDSNIAGKIICNVMRYDGKHMYTSNMLKHRIL